MPLHLRLTGLYVGLATLLVAVFGVVVYLDAQAFYLQSDAARVRAQARPVIARVLDPLPSAQDLRARAGELQAALNGRDTTAVVLDREGEVLAGEREPPVGAQRRAVVPPGPDGEASYVATDGARRVLVVALPLRSADGSLAGSLELLTPLDLIDEVLRRQRQLVLSGIFVTVVAGTAGGLWLTTSSLAPLRRMIARCSRIAAGDFTGRLNRTPRNDEVGQLAAAFDEMAERIEATLAAHRRFIADASHELRTPLTAISGLNEVLLRGGQDDPESADRLAHAMFRQVERLRRLAERLLDLARLDAPLAARRKELDLGRFLWDLLPGARAVAPGRELTLRAGSTVVIPADDVLLEQALFDLVENAHRHSTPGAAIELGWAVVESGVEIWVADEGEGIAARDLPRIFEPLYRSERSRSSATGGAGLGLAIVQAIVHAHGGRIRAESQPGEGARFVITLPREVPSPTDAPAPVEAAPA